MFDDFDSMERQPFGDRIAVRAPSALRPLVHAAARAEGIPAAELIRRAIVDRIARTITTDEQSQAA